MQCEIFPSKQSMSIKGEIINNFGFEDEGITLHLSLDKEVVENDQGLENHSSLGSPMAKEGNKENLPTKESNWSMCNKENLAFRKGSMSPFSRKEPTSIKWEINQNFGFETDEEI